MINESTEARCPLPAAGYPRVDSHSKRIRLPACRPAREKKWCVLWTRRKCERTVYDQLTVKGFELFLPTMNVWIRKHGVRQHACVPMFPGYLFLYHAMDKASYVEMLKARGLVKLLGEAWDRPAVVPRREIEAIQRVHQSNVPVLPHSYLREGQDVRITGGVLTGVEGILLRSQPNKGTLVLSVHLLQRSVAVEVDCTLVVAA